MTFEFCSSKMDYLCPCLSLATELHNAPVFRQQHWWQTPSPCFVLLGYFFLEGNEAALLEITTNMIQRCHLVLTLNHRQSSLNQMRSKEGYF